MADITLREQLVQNLKEIFFAQVGAWHDDETFVMGNKEFFELIPQIVDGVFTTMFVPMHLRDIPYSVIVGQATAHQERSES